MMRAVAWDNNPDEYFNVLIEYLSRLGIEMELRESEPELIAELSQNPGQWDLVITDLMNEDTVDGGTDEDTGVRIADFVKEDKPVYIITKSSNLDPNRMPRGVQVLSKRTPAAYVAAHIRRDLEQRGLFLDRNKVALIYGHDDDGRLRLEKFLSDALPRGCGLEVELLNTETFDGNLLRKLRSIFATAGAVLAFCTADDKIANGKSQPRQNVLLEVGMVFGLANGERRLITVQQWGDKDKKKAVLPSDMGAWLNIQYENNVEHAFPSIREKLRRLRILPPE